ncbi:hypothetical protein [Caudoviricetes sp.]|nr:hypothetical protein [Caudoviricetes sp.]
MLKEKVNQWRFHNSVYDYTVYLRVGGTIKEAAAEFNRLFNCTEEEDGTCEACVFCAEGYSNNFIWFKEKPQAWLIAHESLHSVIFAMEAIGVPHCTPENQEIYAHLLEWTVKNLTRRIWK